MMAGPAATAEEVRQEFAQRKEQIDGGKEVERQQKAAVRQNHNATRQGARRGENINGKVYMSGPTEIEESKDQNVIHLQLDSFKPTIAKNTRLVSTYEAEYIFA